MSKQKFSDINLRREHRSEVREEDGGATSLQPSPTELKKPIEGGEGVEEEVPMLSPVLEADEEENEEEESGNDEEENEEGRGNGEDGGETSGSSTTLLDSSSDESIKDEIANGNRVKNAAEMNRKTLRYLGKTGRTENTIMCDIHVELGNTVLYFLTSIVIGHTKTE
ncbi:predicted protein [Arabidopsis lyrata subsp. lyrata]|uniref:Predicted protein n=1 Tax=Arabidopsis lyrata subsp. lyrata TaxID=81972 RepID=D7KQ28_ARALL|nr:predicted protein [Arabidopsis lyrata subsp. lyrata]